MRNANERHTAEQIGSCQFAKKERRKCPAGALSRRTFLKASRAYETKGTKQDLNTRPSTSGQQREEKLLAKLQPVYYVNYYRSQCHGNAKWAEPMNHTRNRNSPDYPGEPARLKDRRQVEEQFSYTRTVSSVGSNTTKRPIGGSYVSSLGFETFEQTSTRLSTTTTVIPANQGQFVFGRN
ncbi:hypothetical protein K0M31_020153 [Melipona bicolor]|uniref:Uncharacterized protein n=1 Tax=Melipona bicolor TaxID=60889 RepID=A0AA40G115_9HYME|nr:hypothetical protein K0M31_020153 [Melipona bicolor]